MITKVEHEELVNNGYFSMPDPERQDSFGSKSGASAPLSSGLLLPDAVKRIANEGTAIRWDASIGCYEVLDGPLFEQRIEALRRKREGGKDSGRPFSRMHKYYTLESGIGWAKTAAIFKPKSANLIRPPGPAPGASQNTAVQHSVPTFAFDPAAPNGVRASNTWVNAPNPAAEHADNGTPGKFMPHASANVPTQESNKRQRMHPHLDGPEAVEGAVLSASSIKIKLMTGKSRAPYLQETFEVSLQHFLNTINAGDKYERAIERRQATDTSCGSTSVGGDSLPPTTPLSFQEAPSPIESELGLSLKSGNGLCDMQPPMDAMNTDGWNLWSQTSKGDQAYFFQRKAGCLPFANGSIVALSCGSLVPVDEHCEAEMFLVVSDDNAKWKGEPHPSPEQETKGHWCAYLGQVPIKVEGAVKAGQYIGPLGDGSGWGRVCMPGVDPVVGIALMEKAEGADNNVVKCMVSVGLNVLACRPPSLTEEKEQQLIRRIKAAGSDIAEGAAREAQRATRKVTELSQRVDHVQVQVDRLASLVPGVSSMSAPARAPSSSVRRSTWACLFGLCSLTVEEGAGDQQQHEQEDVMVMGVVAATRARDWSVKFERAVTDTAVTIAMVLAMMVVMMNLGPSSSLVGITAAPVELALHMVAAAYLFRPVALIAWEGLLRSLVGSKGEKGHATKRGVVQVVLANRRSVAVLLVWYVVMGAAAWRGWEESGSLMPVGYLVVVVEVLKACVRAVFSRAHMIGGFEFQVKLKQVAV